jgi:hypothetical protein
VDARGQRRFREEMKSRDGIMAWRKPCELNLNDLKLHQKNGTCGFSNWTLEKQAQVIREWEQLLMSFDRALWVIEEEITCERDEQNLPILNGAQELRFQLQRKL